MNSVNAGSVPTSSVLAPAVCSLTLNGSSSTTRRDVTRQITDTPWLRNGRKIESMSKIAEKFASMEYGPALEDPKESLAWLDRHQRKFGHFVNNSWQEPIEGEYF